ncbi:HNH endonuclease [Burkholderia cepacia]|uniref:HNH endonuclease n=1 Tax=Burkholderia cepacia TaxID=292 RepID=UPI001E62BB9B|nr:HNH endonuclease [Burkholderia cepacia]
MAQFDSHLRNQPEWLGWEDKASQKFAIEALGQLYPPRQIVSMATGVPVAQLTGGRQTNSYLGKLSFRVIRLRGTEPQVGEVPAFIVGQKYRRSEDVTGKYGGSGQSGIAPSNQSKAVFLFTGDSGEQYGYVDRFDESNCFLYTGEGQVGDMTMTRGNLAITRHAHDGRALHVFKTTGKGKPCIYLGEFGYSSHFIERVPDKNGDDRNVIVFRLFPVSNTLLAELGEETVIEDAMPAISAASSIGDLLALRTTAIDACQTQQAIADPKEAVRVTYQRSIKVKRYVLARAQGKCELCAEPAPFNRKSDGTPYLEPHHINRLSDGGLDHPLYVGAICPTCHRRIHCGEDGQIWNDKLRNIVVEREEGIQSRREQE